jgi:enterochelin esterase-like enzyme
MHLLAHWSRGATFGALIAMSAAAVAAQAPAPAPRPTAAGAYPQVSSDGRVTFRLHASNAHSVTVTGQIAAQPVALEQQSFNIWTATVGPLAPDLYEYSFVIDGVEMVDPGNRTIKPARNPTQSILEIPGNPPLLQDFQPVPHGKVSLHAYQSHALGLRRSLQVYTPPGYDADAAARFPTLYLFHGSGDTEAMWVALGHAHWMLDNLIAQKQAKPMIVVMTDGHAAVGPGVTSAQNLDAFERDLLGDVMPFVAANYRTQEDGAHRAIIGVSMGGYQSLSIGLEHPELFAWVGGMSSAIMGQDRVQTLALLGDGTALKRQLRLLWFGCGRADGLLAGNERLDAALTARNVPHEFITSAGGHGWPTWRKYFPLFVPKLFQPPGLGSTGANENRKTN